MLKNVEFVRKNMNKAANHISSETLPLWNNFDWLDRKNLLLSYLESDVTKLSQY